MLILKTEISRALNPSFFERKIEREKKDQPYVPNIGLNEYSLPCTYFYCPHQKPTFKPFE